MRDCWVVCSGCSQVVEWVACLSPGVEVWAWCDSVTDHWQRSPGCRGWAPYQAGLRETTAAGYSGTVRLIRQMERFAVQRGAT